MGSALAKVRGVRAARRQFDELLDQRQSLLTIHYSCESFYDRPEGRSARITSIAIRNVVSGQTHSFSIHKTAELRGISTRDIELNYDLLEREMLDDYFAHLKAQQGYRWVHWNMRDINYGFAAIEHRHRVLKGEPFILDDSKKIDLSRLLIEAYGAGYIGNPRLELLMRKNAITDLDFLAGMAEAEAFEKQDYVRLHLSTLRKAGVLAVILQRAADGSLKTNSNWRELYGMTPEAIAEFLKEHWLITILSFVSTIAGLLTLAF